MDGGGGVGVGGGVMKAGVGRRGHRSRSGRSASTRVGPGVWANKWVADWCLQGLMGREK